jgi:hypothetical protein
MPTVPLFCTNSSRYRIIVWISDIQVLNHDNGSDFENNGIQLVSSSHLGLRCQLVTIRADGDRVTVRSALRENQWPIKIEAPFQESIVP